MTCVFGVRCAILVDERGRGQGFPDMKPRDRPLTCAFASRQPGFRAEFGACPVQAARSHCLLPFLQREVGGAEALGCLGAGAAELREPD